MRTVGIGNQDFETIRSNGYFYIDKTNFIREWLGKRGQCNLGHPSQTIRKDLKYEYAGKVLFRQI